ncbi:17585_t:CDS:2 [Entrophospora sp. SA101]|nr:17585_t:CDS:2 [Entrophospora sp. SA101]CAJ0829532.1 2908_t:CDS:2 [Entrophospora sp. SA101]CAJ0852404.1 16870_t:CDS:2 [Entrophospora sp. SA101]
MRSLQLTNSEGTRYKWNINANRDELDVIENSVDRQSPTMPPPTTKRSYEEGKKKEQREFRKTHNIVLDELFVTKPTAMIEKKKVKNAYYRRETSPNVELNDDDLIDGGDDFQARLTSHNRSKEIDTIEMFKRMAEEQRKAGKGLWGQTDNK